MIETRKDLINFRKRLKQSRKEFAKNVGYSYSYIGQVERGDLAFYTGLKFAVNEYAKRLEAYGSANGAYCETMARYCGCYEDYPQEKSNMEEKEADRVLYFFALFACAIIAGVAIWISNGN